MYLLKMQYPELCHVFVIVMVYANPTQAQVCYETQVRAIILVHSTCVRWGGQAFGRGHKKEKVSERFGVSGRLQELGGGLHEGG